MLLPLLSPFLQAPAWVSGSLCPKSSLLEWAACPLVGSLPRVCILSPSHPILRWPPPSPPQALIPLLPWAAPHIGSQLLFFITPADFAFIPPTSWASSLTSHSHLRPATGLQHLRESAQRAESRRKMQCCIFMCFSFLFTLKVQGTFSVLDSFCSAFSP